MSSVGGGNDILVLLAGEDVNSCEVTFGVSVLASLRDRHVTHLVDVVKRIEYTAVLGVRMEDKLMKKGVSQNVMKH